MVFAIFRGSTAHRIRDVRIYPGACLHLTRQREHHILVLKNQNVSVAEGSVSQPPNQTYFVEYLALSMHICLKELNEFVVREKLVTL